MKKYEKEIFRLAKRYANKKRSYLLVNPWQAKHMPVSPTDALLMMNDLGCLTAQKYPSARLVIGFAETATAVGAIVAANLADDCFYVHTTRESLAGEYIEFSEEHSHAVEQKLPSATLSHITGTPVVLVDDEISTGKTMRNMVSVMRQDVAGLSRQDFAAVSMINRLDSDDEIRMEEAHIAHCELCRLENIDYESRVRGIPIEAAQTATGNFEQRSYRRYRAATRVSDVRKGEWAGLYYKQCRALAAEVLSYLSKQLAGLDSALIIGTEEFMYPALICGKLLEAREQFELVRCQATTRSPIGVCIDGDYPIYEGHSLHSFYENERQTYIYDLANYDAVIVVTDADGDKDLAMHDIMAAFGQRCDRFCLVEVAH